MKGIIHRILISESEGFKSSSEEDWSWTEDTPSIELGRFEMDDVGFGGVNMKVNVFTDKVIYHMDSAEELGKYIGETIEDDWVLRTLLEDGWYSESYYPPELDSEEINYILPYNITDRQIERVDKILNSPKLKKLIEQAYPNPRQLDLFKDKYLNQYRRKQEITTIEQFFKNEKVSFKSFLENETVSELEKIFDLIENGLWSEFRNEVIYRAESNLESNRTVVINNMWDEYTDGSRGFEIAQTSGYYGNEIIITIYEPDFRNNLSDILENGLSDITSFYWSDYFYENWDYSDAGDTTYVEDGFDSFLVGVEEALEEI